MTEKEIDYVEGLVGLDASATRRYLTRHSGLPGPRGNLTLMGVAGKLLAAPLARELADDRDEFLACCGVISLGRLILEHPDDATLLGLLTARAADARWRVREAAAMAGQVVGDGDPARLRELVADWVSAADPLVVRAGIAAICEPRLLVDPRTAAAALDACARATVVLTSVPPGRRRDERVRVLRKGLAYCWSVAVAGSPDEGLRRFLALDTTDPDVAWVVRQNRAKQRLKRLLCAASRHSDAVAEHPPVGGLGGRN